MTVIGRTTVLLATATSALLMLAWPASAHGNGVYRTTAESVRPAVAGLAVTVAEDGAWIRVTNTGAEPVVVLGLDGEPVLRVARDGVWRSDRAPAVDIVDERRPAAADVAPPHWLPVSTGSTVRFRDIRVPRPPAGLAAPAGANGQRVISRWTVPLRAGTEDVTVHGALTWSPAPVPWLWVGSLLVGAAGFLALVAMAMRRDPLRSAPDPTKTADLDEMPRAGR